MKRTEWSAEAYPMNWEEYVRYVQETTPQQRDAILTERKRREGLIRWNTCWVTPEQADELELNFQEGLRRDRRALADARLSARSYGLYWC